VRRTVASMRTLSFLLMALLALDALWAVRDVTLIAHEISLLERVDAGGFVSFAEGAASDERRAASAIGFVLLLAASGIVWCVWQFRGQRNLESAGRGGLRFTPGWAVGWWFIPIANLWKPFQTVRELWSRSDPDEQLYVTTGWWVIGLWWAALLVGRVTVFIGSSSPTVRDQIAADQQQVVSNASTMVAAGLAMVIVRAVERRQARLATWSPPAPARPDGGLALPAPPG
jgi:Domain of unknown function (DUF4328)